MFTMLWRFIRQVSGDDAYERYLDHHKRAHPDIRPLDRKLFFKREQEKKWSGINRCC
ncbi:YbdD/YjiX family protein [Legionella dresdenensis]|uniref:YbdD/YjiX family protein n=1 Tax=Legionella dresdenensis TaxID=450200 RepID=A0ABV8CFZ7_9GAMM